MDLYLISGFLGSGKTSSIIEMSKHLMRQGKKVGVVTNDQGKYLVDTAFIRASHIPVVDVQSGCFCSNYQDLIRQLDELKNLIDPDVVFAESIGSAGNLVGTVMTPMLEGSDHRPNSLSCMVDVRLLLRLVRNEYLPFSDSVNATFMNQMNESDLLIINKIDLLSSSDVAELKNGIPGIFGTKTVVFQSAFSTDDIEKTLHQIAAIKARVAADLSYDPALHQKALDKLIWNEQVYTLENETGIRAEIEAIISDLLLKLKAEHGIIAHIKILIEHSEGAVKLSITSLTKTSGGMH